MRIAPGPLLAMAALLASAAAPAACPLDEQVLTGTVLSAADDAPVGGAAIEASWNERAAGRMSISREADAAGGFELRIAFDTYSGRTLAGRDVCDARLQSLDLEVSRTGFRNLRRTLTRAELAQPLQLQLRPAP
jgi:hypothetical protein